MLPGPEPMGAPTSFTARRPNASNLPQFELPPPQLPSYPKHQHSYPGQHQTSASASLTSVGNLLTPPSGSSSDGLSPTSTAPSNNMGAPYTPGAYSWGQGAPMGFHPAMTPNAFNSSRGPFSPGIGGPQKIAQSPNMADVHGDVQGYSMSAPVSLPSMPQQQQQHQHHMGYGVNQGMTQASPVTSHDGFRPHSASGPTHYGAHSAPAPQTPMGYSTGGSMQQSPMSVSGHMPRMSPAHPQGQIPSLGPQSPYNQQRPYSYPLPGPVLSNMGTPGGQMSLVGSMPSGMVGYNSGHLAQMPHLYGHGAQAVGPNSDRPFKCDQCPQSFNRNHDLKRHKRIHLAVKPFPCGHCDKSFSRKDALKRHILVKGCGKSGAHMGGDKHSSDGSMSPSDKSDMSNSSPVIAQTA